MKQGDIVPADTELSFAVGMKTEESVLTGEAVPIDKSADHDPGARTVYMGTSVAAGRGEGVVRSTGLNTSFGQIADLSARVDRQPTTLQIQLGRLARQMGGAALLIAMMVVAIGVGQGRVLPDVFMLGVSLAVSIVPEGLPAVITVTLALGAGALARKGALARRMQAVETLGAASVVCTDKTGTLTENKMTAVKVWTPQRIYTATWIGPGPSFGSRIAISVHSLHRALGRSGDRAVRGQRGR